MSFVAFSRVFTIVIGILSRLVSSISCTSEEKKRRSRIAPTKEATKKQTTMWSLPAISEQFTIPRTDFSSMQLLTNGQIARVN